MGNSYVGKKRKLRPGQYCVPYIRSCYPFFLSFSYPFLPPRYAEIISNVDVETAANMREFITL